MTLSGREFAGNDRFVVQRRLGSGGHGIVYEALDRERGGAVALKALGRNEPGALLRFKYEFRALADISHPNLVALYELLSEGDEWFLTMELVAGCDFLSYVWRFDPDAAGGTSPLAESPTASRLDVLSPPAIGFDDPEPPPRHETPADMPRLEGAMRQLATGLRVLHQAGKLHRDIKPSNVLVTPDGHVKIVDFGLVKELVSFGGMDTHEIAGTPAYMSPEQSAGQPVSAASDWYSVGALLYEALTGRRPFHGTMAEVLAFKQRRDPMPPRELVAGVPDHLNALCAELLHREPSRRAAFMQVSRALGATAEGGEPAAEASLFVGRESTLEELHRGFEEMRAGGTVLVALHGRSGMGKSTLARQFLSELTGDGRLVLESCCYSQESVPYKAVDGLVDGLTEYVRRLPPESALEILPHDLPALARLFPVLNQFLSPSEAVHEVPDLQELRRRAARALRELLSELGRKLDLVVFIDDLQWGDADSAPLLLELLDGPEPPRMLLVVAYRSEDAASAVLQPLLALGTRGSPGLTFCEISVGELTADDARGLARELIGNRPGADEEVERLVREAGGNPFFLLELARAGAVGGLRLDDLLRRRVERLSEPERRLLEVISVAGEPIERRVAAEAAGIGTREPAVLARLRTGHFLRESVAGGVESIAAYHDRLRETLVAALTPDARREHHRALAAAMERATRRDAERMSIHFRGAGDMDRASRYARDAADRAAQALAFDRAARLYSLALEHPTLDELQAKAVRASLAEALANAGRNREAAQAYLAAAQNVDGTAAIELRRCAAEQFLRGGYANEGLEVVRSVLASLGLTLPASRPRAILRLLLLRLRIRLRGLEHTPRLESQLSAEERIRIDACWSVTFCLGFVDHVLAGYLQARNLLWALGAGEPYRVALALLGETAYTCPGGNRSRDATLRVLERATRLAEQVNRPHSTAMVSLTAGIAANYVGRWRECAEKTGQAERIFREQCTGVAHELANSIYWRLWALSQCGRLVTLKRELPVVLKDAQDRGDLYLSTNVRLRGGYLAALADDDPGRAREDIDAAMKGWTFIRVSNQHVWEMFGRAHVALYEGDGPAARRIFEDGRWMLRATLMFRVQFMRTLAASLGGRAAVAAARSQPSLRREARRYAARLRAEGITWADALGAVVEAGAASYDEDETVAAFRLNEALRAFEAAEMSLHAAAVRRVLGTLIGGHEGRGMTAEADAAMQGEGVKNPARMAAMLAPGRWA